MGVEISVRSMGYDDIDRICKADHDESEKNKGMATALMDAAEAIAEKHGGKVYLEVCLNSEYGPAQRFYVKRGYVPDGKGVYYEGRVCGTDAPCKNDDELTLCLVKELA